MLLYIFKKDQSDNIVYCAYSLLCLYCRGSTAEAATRDILDNQIPKLRDLCNNGELHIDNIDVFCEKGEFNAVACI